MADLKGNLRLAFPEQIAAFRLRLRRLIPTAKWDDFLREAHDSGFMVAGAVKAELLADLGAAVDRAIAEGTGWQAFQKDFRAIVEKNGWHGWTGEETAKGRAWRMKVIYKTNMATSYAAGRWAQIKAAGFALIVYRHGASLEPRIKHLGWDGLILPADHPFWATHAPPNGWGCSCFVAGARNEAGAVRVGGRPSAKLPENWNSRDPRTGAPPGIDRGWDYAPGASVSPVIQAMAAKTVNWPYALAKAFMDEVPLENRDAFASGLRSLPSLKSDVRLYAARALNAASPAERDAQQQTEPFRTLGLLRSDQVKTINGFGTGKVDGFDFVIDPSAIRHVINNHGNDKAEAARGQLAVLPSDFDLLVDILDRPDTIEPGGVSDVGRPIVLFTKRIANRSYFAAMEIRSAKRRMVALQSLWIRNAAG